MGIYDLGQEDFPIGSGGADRLGIDFLGAVRMTAFVCAATGAGENGIPPGVLT